MPALPHAIVITGVSGSGKTTVARGLALHYGYAFLDADDLHAAEARAQMAAGVPLNDAQRAPWVYALQQELRRLASKGISSVLAFSGLRTAHRQQLRDSGVPVRFVYLHAAPDLISARSAQRVGHFMPPQLLASQFETLQPPVDEPDVVAVEIDGTPAHILVRVIEALGEPLLK